MGCDIHLFAETKKNGRWESADAWEVDEDYDPPRSVVPYAKRFYDDRCYNLFAILADVRNGRGFAGCKTGEGFIPISKPKGLPDDVSENVKSEAQDWEGDGHSHSWHTLADIFSFDWTRRTILHGVVSAPRLWAWNRYRRENGLGPEEYSGDVWGQMVKFADEKELSNSIATFVNSQKDKTYAEIERAIDQRFPHTYARISWEVPYFRAAGSFFSEAVPKLLRLGKPEDVRIVFWFDN